MLKIFKLYDAQYTVVVLPCDTREVFICSLKLPKLTQKAILVAESVPYKDIKYKKNGRARVSSVAKKY